MIGTIRDQKTITFVIIATSIQECFFRSTLDIRDKMVRKWISAKVDDKDEDEKKLLDRGWMASISNAMILEIFAIFISRFMIILFARHKYAFASLGYFTAGYTSSVQSAMVFNMVFELCAELVVDWFAVSMEVAKGVPVLDFFNYLTKGTLIGLYTTMVMIGTVAVLIGLITSPSAGRCNTPSDVCECITTLPHYIPLCQNASRVVSLPNQTLINKTSVLPAASSASFLDALGLSSVQEVIIAAGSLVLAVIILKLVQVFSQMKRARVHMKIQESRISTANIQLRQASVKLNALVADLDAAQKATNIACFTEEEQQLIASAFDPKDDTVQLLQSWEIEESSIVIGKEIGHGAFGVVREAHVDDQKVAVKQIKHGGITESSLQSFLQEAEFLCKVSHPNIVPFRGYIASDKFLLLAMGFANGGTIKSYLATEHNPPLDWYQDKIPVMMGVSRGMEYVHCSNIIHRDLKNENVLLKKIASGVKPWIADFGESTEILDYTMTSVGTPLFCAPEVLKNEFYDGKADIYSFGVMLYSCACERGDIQPHFTTVEDLESGGKIVRGYLQVSTSIVEGWRPEIPPGAPPRITNLIGSCWSSDTSERPTFRAVTLELQRTSKENQ